jgi:hypothetical protein
MGIEYNVRPLSTKEFPYIDVLSEAINNPILLLLGWFALIPDRMPPLSLILAYWMAGAYFMATKRYAEYRQLHDQLLAPQYRKSFGYYTEDQMLISMLFYVTACALFLSSTPVSSHCLSWRQQVEGLPYRRGSSLHWEPVQRMQRMPSEQRRSTTRGRPTRGKL